MLRRVIVVPEATRKVQGRSVYLVAITENPVTSLLVFCIVHCRGNRVHPVNCLSRTSYPLDCRSQRYFSITSFRNINKNSELWCKRGRRPNDNFADSPKNLQKLGELKVVLEPSHSNQVEGIRGAPCKIPSSPSTLIACRSWHSVSFE